MFVGRLPQPCSASTDDRLTVAPVGRHGHVSSAPAILERPVYGIGEAASLLGPRTDRSPAVEAHARNTERIGERKRA